MVIGISNNVDIRDDGDWHYWIRMKDLMLNAKIYSDKMVIQIILIFDADNDV